MDEKLVASASSAINAIETQWAPSRCQRKNIM